VYSFDGIQLGVVCETAGWTWSCCVRPGRNVNQVVSQTNDMFCSHVWILTCMGMCLHDGKGRRGNRRDVKSGKSCV